eukprot:3931698-Rhodomonas_salina.1
MTEHRVLRHARYWRSVGCYGSSRGTDGAYGNVEWGMWNVECGVAVGGESAPQSLHPRAGQSSLLLLSSAPTACA